LSRFPKKFENKDVFLPVRQSELASLLPKGFLRRKIISGQTLRSTGVTGEAMDQALHMPLAERRERWFNMMDVLRRSDITRWRKRSVTAQQSAA